MDEYIVEVQDLVKRYANLTAVNGISFKVKKGEVFGLLGPNGAGKTTTLNAWKAFAGRTVALCAWEVLIPKPTFGSFVSCLVCSFRIPRCPTAYVPVRPWN